MTMIFERDESGLLYQVNKTVEDIAAEGRNLTLMSVQQWYVLLTAQEEKTLKDQRDAAKAQMEKIKLEEETKIAETKKEREALFTKQQAIFEAQKKEQEAKDSALTLALEKLEKLTKEVETLKAAS